MKSKLNIICHAFPSWSGNYAKSTVELMKTLAIKHRVLYLDYNYTLKDLFKGLKSRHIPILQILGFRNPLRNVILDEGNEISVLSLPPSIPCNWINAPWLYEFVQKINAQFIVKRVKKAIRNLGLEEPALINAFNPGIGCHVKEGLDLPTIYYCYDNIDQASWASKHGFRSEKKLIKSSQAVIYSSDELKRNRAQFNNNSYVVKNGVNTDIFNRPKEDIYRDFDSQPIKIGYVGSLDHRLDYDLLRATIAQQKDWEFHFIGRVNSPKAEQLKSMSNVVFHGAKETSKLPELMLDFRAGIIPFVKDEFTKNIYPLKANEYLAMGLPVVMTDFAQLDDLSNVVACVNHSQFASTLEFEVCTDNPRKKKNRIEKAQLNNWHQKAIEFESIIRKHAC